MIKTDGEAQERAVKEVHEKLKVLEDGSAQLTVQNGLNPAQRVALHQSELGALKEVL